MRVHPKRSRPDGGDAFVPDPQGGHGPLPSDDAESLAEEFIASATSAEPVEMEARDEVVEEELGGPFVGIEGLVGPEGEEGDEVELQAMEAPFPFPPRRPPNR
ncbi:MAG: hypothetical protein KF819_27685 [Labilithrix sp.]|nr:hypothetical protein [Labilithrix sp.]